MPDTDDLKLDGPVRVLAEQIQKTWTDRERRSRSKWSRRSAKMAVVKVRELDRLDQAERD